MSVTQNNIFFSHCVEDAKQEHRQDLNFYDQQWYRMLFLIYFKFYSEGVYHTLQSTHFILLRRHVWVSRCRVAGDICQFTVHLLPFVCVWICVSAYVISQHHLLYVHTLKSFHSSSYQRNLKLDEFCDPSSPSAAIFYTSCLKAFLQPFH